MTMPRTELKQPAESKHDPRDVVIAALLAMLLVPFVGIVRALAYRLLWDWFLAPQYGEGPTLQAWFGIGILYTMISARHVHAKEDSKSPVRDMLAHVFIDLLVVGAMIVAAAMARVVWGWR